MQDAFQNAYMELGGLGERVLGERPERGAGLRKGSPNLSGFPEIRGFGGVQAAILLSHSSFLPIFRVLSTESALWKVSSRLQIRHR